jgi:hypothetical protein
VALTRHSITVGLFSNATVRVMASSLQGKRGVPGPSSSGVGPTKRR